MAPPHPCGRALAPTLLMIALALTASPLGAQVPGTRAPVPHDQVLSANPFLILFEWFNGEYERKVSPTWTVGVGGSLVSSDADYASLNLLARYYPQEAALSGFYFGPRLGFYHVSDDDSGNAFGFGLELGYSWLLGPRQNFLVSIGVGAVRLFGGDLGDVSLTVPTLRLVNVGWAF